MSTPELHIEPRAASSCVRFLESMRSRYVQALKGTPIIGKKPLNLAHRGGTNAEAHRRYLAANTPVTDAEPSTPASTRAQSPRSL